MSPTVRRATADDAEAIAEIHARSGDHAYRGLLPDDFLDQVSIPVLVDRWRSRASSSDRQTASWVAEVDGHIVGFCHVSPNLDDDATAETGYLHAIYVNPDVVGRGIGRVLLQLAEGSMREAGFVVGTLWVLAGNMNARHFYERNGWQPHSQPRTDDEADPRFIELRYWKRLQ